MLLLLRGLTGKVLRVKDIKKVTIGGPLSQHAVKEPHDLLQMIDPTILYEQITDLEWMAKYPLMFENMSGKLVLSPFNQEVYSLICENDTQLPRGIGYIREKRLVTPENLF